MGAIKRAVVKQQPIQRVAKIAIPEHHAHGCVKCKRRYMDKCAIADVNGVCMTCKHGHAVPTWDLDASPKDCCRAHSGEIRDRDELIRYKLGGPGPWFRCRVCSRTHPYDPTKENT